MVFTVLASLSPHTDAQAAGADTRGCIMVAPYPDFGIGAALPSATVYSRLQVAKKGDTYASSVVRVANSCTDFDANELRFLSGAAGLIWDADHSHAPGWVTSRGSAGELVFKATTTEALKQSRASCGRTFNTGATNLAFPNQVTSSTAVFALADVGQTLYGTNIPAGATITAFTDAQTITISASVTGTGSSLSLAIGTAPCSTTVLRDASADFNSEGIVAGMGLNIMSGAAIGRYTISQVGTDELIFSPPAPAIVIDQVRYVIVPATGLNATLLAGGSLLTTGLQARAQDFTIAWAGGSGTVPVQVIAYPAIYPEMIGPPSTVPPTPFETTCPSTAANGWRCLTAADSTDPTRGQAPSINIALSDATAPTMASAIARDMDRNGHVDRIVVTFSERLDPHTFSTAGFVIHGCFKDCSPKTNNYRIENFYLTDTPTATVATLLLKEQPYYDTSGPYGVQYVAPFVTCNTQAPPSCGIRDLSGNVLQSVKDKN
ncbi:MAG: hypothetical protein ABR562_08650, partial [Thermoplasmatota archaeon]